ncbi:MAG: Gfo/Idh/MocA family oxidoreductase [Sterolibacteriaceae bacterium MAG5]|nr:Gfo/Idh/MocA family oxidoreductase [Candidatus Nitricoxidireducens bremensis]
MRDFRVVVVGLGIQGRKRAKVAGGDLVALVDPVVSDAHYQTLYEVPLDSFDAALLCIPDQPKVELLTYLMKNGKHALVEKPLLAETQEDLTTLAAIVKDSGCVCYTAYNHRFEPHFVRMQQALAGGGLGRIYRVRFFYGNGTARDVRNSVWRDAGTGVLPDLGSHLLDTLLYMFGGWPELKVWSAHCFENKAFDHILLGGLPVVGMPQVELEMSLLSWRNHFVAEVYGELGSLHIDSLCKWGPSTFTHRHRVLPSGRPPEESVTLVQPDPTWELEYVHFKQLCQFGGEGNLKNDLRINQALLQLAAQAQNMQ